MAPCILKIPGTNHVVPLTESHAQTYKASSAETLLVTPPGAVPTPSLPGAYASTHLVLVVIPRNHDARTRQ